MPGLRVQNMGGIIPRMSDRLLPGNSATTAENCKLWSGEIRPLRMPAVVNAPLRDGFIRTIYSLYGQWLSWNTDVDVVRGFVPNDVTGRIYYTGDGPPKVTNSALAFGVPPYPSTGFILGVSAPPSAPTVALGAGGTPPSELRAYVYTYLTAFDEEGPPSVPSIFLNANDGQAVTVSGFTTSTSQNVNRIRIYRLETGTAGTEYLLVDTISSLSASYVDTKLGIDLGERLQSFDWTPPPSNMVGLVSHPGGFLAGFVGNQMYVSEAYQPQAYPEQYKKIFDYPVVALGVYGNTIVVATTGYVYLVTGVTPSNLTVEKLPDPYPCVSKRSLTSGDRGVFYASNDGLMLVGYGGLQVVTRDVLSRDEWRQYNPRTIHGEIYDGRYIGFYLNPENQVLEPVSGAIPAQDPTGAGFIYDINDRATGVEQRDKLTTLNFYATATYASPDTNLHYVTRKNLANTLNEWEASTKRMEFRWRSKAFVMPYITSFAAAKVVGRYDAATAVNPESKLFFELIVGNQVKYRREVKSSQPFRLPRFYRETEPWYLFVEGTITVQEIHMATSMEELREGAAQ